MPFTHIHMYVNYDLNSSTRVYVFYNTVLIVTIHLSIHF